MADTTFEVALAAWSIDPGSVDPVGSGYINDTFRVNTDYLLQRVNAYVFDDPAEVVGNQAKLIAATDERRYPPPLVPLIKTDAGESFFQDPDGAIWRLQPWIDGRNFDDLPDHLVYAAAHSFGQFGRFFSDADIDLSPTIASFHDLESYLSRWDDVRIAADLGEEERRIATLHRAFAAGRGGALIHGDCKVNNLLFHSDRDDVLAILDLDTAMRGDSAWDFGDLARSVCTSAERPTSTWWNRLAALGDGFVTGFGEVDSEHFALAPAYMSFMLAVRFLTDHLEGDVYFKIDRRGDNLRRGRIQLDTAERFYGVRERIARLLDVSMETPGERG